MKSLLASVAAIALLTLLLAALAGAPAQPQASRAQAAAAPVAFAEAHRPARPIRAAHWFGAAWPVNAWSTRLEAQAEADFARLRADGFDTVVLVLPWPGLAPDRHAPALDPARVAQVRAVIDAADRAGLDVVLRLGYAWDAGSPDQGARLLALWTDPAAHAAWLGHLEALWVALGDAPRLRFAFITWEDLWAVTDLGHAGPEERLAAAASTGYRDWLRARMDLDAAGRAYGTRFASWDEVPLPARREPAFGELLHFVDHAWVHRFFVPARERFPRLGMEVRVDADPVYAADGSIARWHGHEAAWDLPGAEWIGLYWAPFMGGANTGETVSVEEALARLRGLLERVRAVAGERGVFVDQFLVQDFTQGFEANGRLAPEDVPAFLEGAAPLLAGLADGAALWAWRDYAHDALHNGDFARGLEGWTTEGEVEAGPGGARLAAGAALERRVAMDDLHQRTGHALARLCVVAEALAPGARLAWSGSGEGRLAPAGDRRQCVDFPLDVDRTLRLAAEGGGVRLSEVRVEGFVQASGMRDMLGEPKTLHPAWRAFNAALAAPAPASSSLPALHADGWMGAVARAPLDPPRHPGPLALRVRTFLPPDWPQRPRLRVAVGDRGLEATCEPGGEWLLLLDPAAPAPAEARLAASATHVPEGDARALGCLITDLALVPAPPAPR